MQRKAALQPHIGAQSEASPSRIEGFRKFEADLSALFREGIRQAEMLAFPFAAAREPSKLAECVLTGYIVYIKI